METEDSITSLKARKHNMHTESQKRNRMQQEAWPVKILLQLGKSTATNRLMWPRFRPMVVRLLSSVNGLTLRARWAWSNLMHALWPQLQHKVDLRTDLSFWKILTAKASHGSPTMSLAKAKTLLRIPKQQWLSGGGRLNAQSASKAVSKKSTSKSPMNTSRRDQGALSLVLGHQIKVSQSLTRFHLKRSTRK